MKKNGEIKTTENKPFAPLENDAEQISQDTSCGATDGFASYSPVPMALAQNTFTLVDVPGLITTCHQIRIEEYDKPDDLERRQVANCLRKIGGNACHKVKLDRVIDEIIDSNPQAAFATFCDFVSETFQDGEVNWERVGVLFYFAYKINVNALNPGESTKKFVTENLAWIASREEWTMVPENIGPTPFQLTGLFIAGLVTGYVLF